MSDLISSHLGVHATALPLRQQRMQVIASNLANADTPNYKARDLEFQSVLENAARNRAPGGNRAERAPGRLDLAAQLFERAGVQPSLDGNTVDADTERAAYGRAALEYRASLSFLESKVRSMLTAITGQ